MNLLNFPQDSGMIASHEPPVEHSPRGQTSDSGPADGPAGADRSLRERSEELARQGAGGAVAVPAAMSPEAARQALHELHVHQIELEMQNEELRRAQHQADEALERYLDLFNTAPVGYVIVSRAGMLLEVNHTVATLLGVARHQMVNQPMARFILREDQGLYYQHRRRLIASGRPEVCEVRLVKHDGKPVWVRLDFTLSQGWNGQWVSRIMLCDISGQKGADEELLRNHAELQARNQELANFNNIAVGREMRMIELKAEINALCQVAGEAPRYQLDFGDEP